MGTLFVKNYSTLLFIKVLLNICRKKGVEHPPDLPMKAGKVQSIEFEYKRHGTQILMGGFNVATGEIQELVQETRTERDNSLSHHT